MDPKCKPSAHLRVVVGRDPGAFGPDDQTAVYVAELACRNETSYHGWGAVIDPKGRQQGMHLFPEAVAMLASQLPIVAAEARATHKTGSVVIQHTVGGKFAAWRSVTPDAAVTLGSQLGTIAAAHA